MKHTSEKSQREDSITPPDANLWIHLHVLNQHWLSDLEFYEDELSFFRILIDKHLELLLDEKNIDQTKTIVSRIQNLEKQRTSTAHKIKKHLAHMSALIENPFAQNAQTCKDEHEKLEIEFLEFVNQYRTVKREVFKLTQLVIGSGKVSRLIERM